MDVNTETFKQSPLGHIYYNLRAEKYAHNVALWAAWYAHRANKETLAALGLPAHQYEFAALLGVSDRTLRKYPAKHPELLEMARSMMVENVLADYVPGALAAMGEAAALPNNYGTADRRLLFEMAGVYTPKSKTDVTSGDEPLKTAVNIYLPDNGRD